MPINLKYDTAEELMLMWEILYQGIDKHWSIKL